MIYSSSPPVRISHGKTLRLLVFMRGRLLCTKSRRLLSSKPLLIPASIGGGKASKVLSTASDTAWAFDYLTQLVDGQEQIWFAACDTDHDPSKFWLFQGTVQAIQRLLQAHCYFEYYLVSKKYRWLLCETDHDVLIGLGSVIPRMQQLNAPGSVILPETSRPTLKQNDKAA
jgi:hypothetical protein